MRTFLAFPLSACSITLADDWEKYEEAGYPAAELLANRGNHPSVTGHEGFAKVLMKLIV